MTNDRSGRRITAANFLAPALLFTSIYALARAESDGSVAATVDASTRESPQQMRQPRAKKEEEKQQKPKREAGHFPRPFEGNYPITLAVSIVALAPFIIMTTAYAMFSTHVQADLHGGQRATSIIEALSTAAYAFGALLGGDLMQRFRQRRLFLLCEGLFVIGCLASSTAHGMLPYGAGRVLSGFGTGMLLVAALPPVIQRFPPEKLPITVIFVNLGFFGAVCAGPMLGGWVAAGHHWRWFFGGLGALGALNLFVALFEIPKMPPMNPGAKFDYAGLLLALLGVFLPFWASGELSAHNFASFRFAVPMSTGLVCFIGLLLVEYHGKAPISPVKQMFITPSIVGTMVAMFGGGVFVTFLELGERFQMEVLHRSPLQAGLIFWPMLVGVVITALLLGALLRTRGLVPLILGGIIALIGGGVLILNIGASGSPVITMAAAGLLGLGAGGSVAPGLFMAALPLPPQSVGKVFALVELVRSVADYIISPVIMRIARNGSAHKPLDWGGIHEATWIALWLLIAFTIAGVGMWIAGGMGFPRPDIKRWINDNKPAIPGNMLFARLRGSPQGE